MCRMTVFLPFLRRRNTLIHLWRGSMRDVYTLNAVYLATLVKRTRGRLDHIHSRTSFSGTSRRDIVGFFFGALALCSFSRSVVPRTLARPCSSLAAKLSIRFQYSSTSENEGRRGPRKGQTRECRSRQGRAGRRSIAPR